MSDGTCVYGLALNNYPKICMSIASTIDMLKPREYVELEPGPLSPIDYLKNSSRVLCSPTENYSEYLRGIRDTKSEWGDDVRIFTAHPVDAVRFFNSPGTLFYFSRFVGCQSKECPFCMSYNDEGFEIAYVSFMNLMKLYGNKSQLVFPFASKFLLNSENIPPDLQILWSVKITDNCFLSLMRKLPENRGNKVCRSSL